MPRPIFAGPQQLLTLVIYQPCNDRRGSLLRSRVQASLPVADRNRARMELHATALISPGAGPRPTVLDVGGLGNFPYDGYSKPEASFGVRHRPAQGFWNAEILDLSVQPKPDPKLRNRASARSLFSALAKSPARPKITRRGPPGGKAHEFPATP